jgi:hypothetical protein
MPYSWRLCVINTPENMVPFPKPPNYNPEDFEVLRRYTVSLGQPTLADIVSELEYNGEIIPCIMSICFTVDLLHAGYPANASRPMRYDLCESGGSAVSSDEPTPIYAQYIVGNRAARRAVADRVRHIVGR